MGQQKRHTAVRMDIPLDHMGKYHQLYNPESGTNIKYDILQLENNQDALRQWYEQRWTKETNTKNPLKEQINKQGGIKDKWALIRAKVQTGHTQACPINPAEAYNAKIIQNNIHKTWATTEENKIMTK